MMSLGENGVCVAGARGRGIRGQRAAAVERVPFHELVEFGQRIDNTIANLAIPRTDAARAPILQRRQINTDESGTGRRPQAIGRHRSRLALQALKGLVNSSLKDGVDPRRVE